MIPAWRGENGHGGHFEFLAGEVDDAVAAAKWLAQQPHVDPQRVYAFGGGTGGGIAALLSLTDAPLRMTGSSDGLLAMHHISTLGDALSPFDARDPNELRLRSLLPNMAYMKRRHIAYISNNMPILRDSIVEVERQSHAKPLIEIRRVPGDPSIAFRAAMTDFFNRIKADGK
jgi:hypothetical protein